MIWTITTRDTTKSMKRLAIGLIALLGAACADSPVLTQPSLSNAVVPATIVSLEGEEGAGDGVVRARSRASGGQTVHLGPGERRSWTFKIPAAPASYAVTVTYSNGQEGENEELDFRLDGALVGSFRNRDSGDAIEGWNQFVTDPAGRSTLGLGAHTLTIDVRGGDGCVEIDKVTITPA